MWFSHDLLKPLANLTKKTLYIKKPHLKKKSISGNSSGFGFSAPLFSVAQSGASTGDPCTSHKSEVLSSLLSSLGYVQHLRLVKINVRGKRRTSAIRSRNECIDYIFCILSPCLKILGLKNLLLIFNEKHIFNF